MARHFTWRESASQFQAAVGYERLRAPYSGDGSWRAMSEKLYPVVTARDWKADIGGKSYYFVKGETYYEPADVKRVLFTADVLDPVCFDPADGSDTGLLPDQAKAAQLPSASHHYCRECGQKLGSGTTRAQDMLAELEGVAA